MSLKTANETSFKKGMTPWNKGKKALSKDLMEKKCRGCKKEFTTRSLSQRYCDPTCPSKQKKCLKCEKPFKAYIPSLVYCSLGCAANDSKEKRKGKGNPAYRNGFAMNRSILYTGVHLRACAKYRKHFRQTHDWMFCELCHANETMTPRFEVHHIYFASLYPRHPELHNFLNLILLCIRCHNDMHSGKKNQHVFEDLEERRGLKELFKKEHAYQKN